MVRRTEIVTLRGAEDIIDAIREGMEKFPKRARKKLLDLGAKKAGRILNVLREYPGNVKYPIEWKTPKQRRYVMGIVLQDPPYQRTNNLSKGWKVDIDRSDTIEFNIYNKEDYARFVMGDDQQPFHINTGWRYAPKFLAEERAKLEDELIDLYLSLDPTEDL